jgi:nitrilase
MNLLQPFVVTAVQHPPVFLDLDASVARACSLIAEAAAEGAQLVVFPETWLTGYPVWLDAAPGAALWDSEDARQVYQRLTQNSPTLDGPAMRELGRAAREAGVVLVMGLHERRRGSLYNTMAFFGKEGDLLGIHRKLIPTYAERLVWGRGDGSTLTVVDTPLGRVGGLICWEHWMPLARHALHERQELVHVAQWPTVGSMHLVASQSYAFEGGCFVVAAGTVLRKEAVDRVGLDLLKSIPGAADTLLMNGGSCIISPQGEFLAGPVYDQETLVSAEIDPQETVAARLTLDVTGHYSRPDVFQLVVNQTALENVRWESG